jgi:hypothetical protein
MLAPIFSLVRHLEGYFHQLFEPLLAPQQVQVSQERFESRTIVIVSRIHMSIRRAAGVARPPHDVGLIIREFVQACTQDERLSCGSNPHHCLSMQLCGWKSDTSQEAIAHIKLENRVS